MNYKNNIASIYTLFYPFHCSHLVAPTHIKLLHTLHKVIAASSSFPAIRPMDRYIRL
ncbi:hypothetical protein [Lonomia obliqua multiple nucleopolyhedrovirus]|uniref:Uncharacterized protein n=1 Tax=Lonomia obliqua multiple nucleopolyhedrovirus TaxID=134394 RepID=A0A126FC98_9ABAC|nr:hypothetical protein [Lonomia obliqua multiple nucleopolyhedrovirus]AKN81022.1 hypothetical protein [Lonomia obliqua multiple nucleopolyhedrovirus]